MSDRVNVYTCRKCGGKTTTIDVDEGVTPFMLACRANGEGVCTGMAESSFYHPTPPYPEPTYEWYRPTKEDTRMMTPQMREHIEAGGLDLRPIVANTANSAQAADSEAERG